MLNTENNDISPKKFLLYQIINKDLKFIFNGRFYLGFFFIILDLKLNILLLPYL